LQTEKLNVSIAFTLLIITDNFIICTPEMKNALQCTIEYQAAEHPSKLFQDETLQHSGSAVLYSHSFRFKFWLRDCYFKQTSFMVFFSHSKQRLGFYFGIHDICFLSSSKSVIKSRINKIVYGMISSLVVNYMTNLMGGNHVKIH
jgi:hypothetical protein